MTTQHCATCVWLSNGFHGDKGAGYCYCNEDYRDNDDSCSFWQASLRDESVNEPPKAKERMP